VPRRQQLPSFLLRPGCITGGRLGRSCIAAGSRGSSSSTRCIMSCWRITFGGRCRRSSARSAHSTDRSDAPDWTLAPVVAALQTMRGMALVNICWLAAAGERAIPRTAAAVPSRQSRGWGWTALPAEVQLAAEPHRGWYVQTAASDAGTHRNANNNWARARDRP